MNFAKTLSRNEMKQITGGSPGCHLYCCGDSGCSSGVHCPECDASSHGGCQSAGADAGYVCPGGGYLAALHYE